MKKIPVRQIRSVQKGRTSSERFSIRTMEELSAGLDLSQDLHRHDFFFILVLRNGKGFHEIDFTPYEVAERVVFFLRPGQVHRLHLTAGCTGYLMEFNFEFYRRQDKSSIQRLRKAGNKNFCQPGISGFEKLFSMLTFIFREYSDKQDGYEDMIKAGMDIFFIELVRQSRNPPDTATLIALYPQERLEEFLDLLEIHITHHKKVSQYANIMNLSPYQLNEITKTTVGKTASQLINEHILLEAKRYLLATSDQVKDIADHLGYEDVSYFIRFFRKQTGFSPETFRQIPE